MLVARRPKLQLQHLDTGKDRVLRPCKPAVILPFRRKLAIEPLGTRFSPGFIFVPKKNTQLGVQGAVDLARNSNNPMTFSGFGFGTASSDRWLVAVCYLPSSTASATGVTIGGVAASIIESVGITAIHSCIAMANVPSGTSGDVAVSWSAAPNNIASVILYKVTGSASLSVIDSTAGTVTGVGSNLSKTWSYDANGVVLSLASANGTAAPTFGGSNMTQDWSIVNGNNRAAAFSVALPSGTVNTTLTGGNGNRAIIGVSLKPA